MNGLSQKSRARIAKLIGLLGSDADGEILATVRAVRSALAAEGCDLHALSDLIVGCPTWNRITDRERVAWLRALVAEPLLPATDHARMLSLQRSGVSEPTRADIHLFNRWVSRLHARGVRP